MKNIPMFLLNTRETLIIFLSKLYYLIEIKANDDILHRASFNKGNLYYGK